jgi:hypothetical protein
VNKEDVIMCNCWFIIINTSVHGKNNIYCRSVVCVRLFRFVR